MKEPIKPKSPSKQTQGSNKQLSTTAHSTKSTDLSTSVSNQNVDPQQSRPPAVTTNPLSSPVKPQPPAGLKPSYELQSFITMAKNIADNTGDDLGTCIKLLDATFTNLARNYERLDLGLIDEPMASDIRSLPCTWEQHELMTVKIPMVAEELIANKEISEEQALKRRLITSFSKSRISASPLELEELTRLANSDSSFLRKWYALRLQWEQTGYQIMTNAKQRRALKTAEYDPTYVAPTSFRALAILRDQPLEDHIMAHPGLDRILTEEELHIASRMDSGDFLTDVLTYITHVGIRPSDMDHHAQLEYNPAFYAWLMPK